MLLAIPPNAFSTPIIQLRYQRRVKHAQFFSEAKVATMAISSCESLRIAANILHSSVTAPKFFQIVLRSIA
jgi:hypothetical protein